MPANVRGPPMVRLYLSGVLSQSRLGDSDWLSIEVDSRAGMLRCRGQICLWCGWERIRLNTISAGWLSLSHGGAWDSLPSTSNQLLGLSHTSTSISLDALETFTGMLAGEIFDLLSLSTDHTGCVVDLLINELLVLNVDQWRQEEDASTE